MAPLRTMRPAYVDRLPPCNHACPAGENIQAWLGEAQAGRYREAWEIIVRDNPMPSVHGRVCYHPCEDACNRKDVDEAVNIHAIERFVGDMALSRGWSVAPDVPLSGYRILVVGAGPSGLSAAWHLAQRGHAVTVHDAGPLAGGMMHFGIPKYRLPRAVLDGEIDRIRRLGVEIVLNHKVTDLVAEKIEGGFDAVFLAVGAHLSKRQDIPARDAGKVYDALQFLKSVETGDEPPRIGRRVAIYGGGNTAMDAARTAARLGAEPLIIYRRTRNEMPAHDFEADDALEEGIKIHWLRTIKEIDGTTLHVEVMRLDENRSPVPTGEFETLEADSVVLALGQDTDTTFLKNVPGIEFKKDGTVVVGRDMRTGCPGVFAGGDMVPYARTVTTAVGHGKRAAQHIDAWLRDEIRTKPKHEIATFDMLRLWYHSEARKCGQSTIDLDRRRHTFEEVVVGLDRDTARYEAQRCLSCGNCFECDGCYSACPEQAVIKLGPGRRYAYDLNRCTGCAICYDQCPCGAITMIPESVAAAAADA
ncbi:MAG TPA: NAD(P)-binding protein [Vicinamibacterales bacterium]|jgi:formate dehydrogenase beta subunit|nr:NAD(P)-binding protein [Vicinamibacterales bacterium]